MHRRDRSEKEWTARIVAMAALLATLLATGAPAQTANPHQQFLGGPWEVLVTLGMEGSGMRVPLSIAEENKSQSLSATVPVMGTPVKVKLEQYLPDLKWETAAVDDPNGGPAAKLSLRGESLRQDVWLSARDREKQSISAHVGSVAIRELPARMEARTLQELAEPNAAGALLIWLSQTGAPLVYAATPGRTVALPGSEWKMSVLRYVPQYSIDKETRQVTSLSDRPENPAVEILVEGDKQEHRQWLWSQFAASPHKKDELPFRVRFVDLPVSGKGAYILIVAQGSPPYLSWLENGKKHVEPVVSGKRYPFDDKRYSFAVDEVRTRASIKTTWKNASDMLLHPAVVATMSQGESTQQVVLELGQPCHQKTTVGTLVVLYRRVPQ